MKTPWSALVALVFLAVALAAPAAARPSSLATDEASVAMTPTPDGAVYSGVFTEADHRAYRHLRFEVPPGVVGLGVRLDYERGPMEAPTAIDIALFDPQRFRGSSLGFIRTDLEIEETDATLSYLAGPIPAGTWTLALGGANAPPGRQTPFTAHVAFRRAFDAAPIGLAGADRDAPGWYRGDFHAHTGHSDGGCAAVSGARAPCPVFRTLEAASARGLDFIAVTDHNTVSHFGDLRALQPYFDTLVIIPAQEVTTYFGHMNIFGPRAFVDFRLGTKAAPTFEALAEAARGQGGLVSINHPGISLTEGCPGCGWSAPVADYGQADAIEVVNGVIARWQDGPEGPTSSLPFWIARLNEGHRITAIGGSDNHDPSEPFDRISSIGGPTTVVRAQALSAPAILDGVRAGEVFIDIEGTRDRFLALRARVDGQVAVMGGAIEAGEGRTVGFTVEVKAAPAGARLEIWLDGRLYSTRASERPLGPDESRDFDWVSDGGRHWISANVRSSDGELILIGNPVYINKNP